MIGVDLMRSPLSQRCPHLPTYGLCPIECLSWGTGDLHSGDFQPLRRAHLRHSNCESEYRPEFARQRTCVNMS
jgi:hypothetical protein